MNTKSIVFAVLFLFLVVGSLQVSRQISAPPAQIIPAFSLTDLQSKDTSFTNMDLPEKPFLLNAWASWCVPCQTEYPVLRSIAELNTVDIYGLNYRDNEDDAIQWLNFYGSVYIKNGHDFDGSVSNTLNISVVPTSILFDSRKKAIFRHVGPLTESSVSKLLAHL